MATSPARTVIREILIANPSLSADEVMKKAAARGVNQDADTLRKAVHNIRSELRKLPGGDALPASASAAIPMPAPSGGPAGAAGSLAGLLANVMLVNQVLGLSGGVENARQVAEAVRACGGVDAFLQHLDVVAGIRNGDHAA